MSKICAITSGCDWADASIKHISVPDDMDLQSQVEAYRDYYWKSKAETGYSPDLNFAEWLLEHGGREPDSSELEEFDEDEASGPRPEGLQIKRPPAGNEEGGVLLPPEFGECWETRMRELAFKTSELKVIPQNPPDDVSGQKLVKNGVLGDAVEKSKEAVNGNGS